MTVLNYAKRNTALLIGGSITEIPTYFMLGSGSGVTVVTQTTLIAPVLTSPFTSKDSTGLYNVKYIGDWNSLQVSGLTISEFGLIATSGTGLTGSMWTANGFPGIVFDGTNELHIEEIIQVF